MSKGRKRPIAKEKPRRDKKPRAVSITGPQSPLWSFVVVDIEGPWGFSSMEMRDLVDVLNHLKNFEGMTWVDIERNTGSHPIEVKDIINTARKRLRKLRQDDIEELFSLRIGGRKRIWGIRVRDTLRILWWDPNHEISPSQKK